MVSLLLRQKESLSSAAHMSMILDVELTDEDQLLRQEIAKSYRR